MATQAQINALLDNFKSQYAGKRPGYFGYTGECLSLAKLWVNLIAAKSIAPASGNGKGSGYFTNFPAPLPDYFDKVTWQPGKSYPRGSLVVYSQSSHIAIYESTSGGFSTVFEQNADPDASAAHTAQRANSRIDGILVIKTDAPAPPAAPKPAGDEMITSADEATKIYKLLRPNSNPSQDEINTTAGKRSYVQFINDAQHEVSQRDANLRDQAVLVSNQQGAINQLNQQLASLNQQLAEAQAGAMKAAQSQPVIADIQPAVVTEAGVVDAPMYAPAPAEPKAKKPTLLTRLIVAFLKRKKA